LILVPCYTEAVTFVDDLLGHHLRKAAGRPVQPADGIDVPADRRIVGDPP
jgi:hypothetical protein